MSYRDKAIEAIDLVSEGLSVAKACEKVQGLSRKRFYQILKDDEEVRNNYARAMELRENKFFEEIISISDDGASDKTTDKNGNEKTDNEAIQRSKLRVDSRKWVLSRMNPKKYGDRLNVDHDAENKGTPPNIIWKSEDKSS